MPAVLLAVPCLVVSWRGRVARSGGAGRRPRRAGAAAGRDALLGLAAAFAAGAALGLRAGDASGSSCVATLRSGDPVAVSGALEAGVRGGSVRSPAPGRRWARAVLLDPVVRGASGECRPGRLLARFPRPAAGLRGGSRVVVRGEWRSYGPAPGGVRPRGSYGAVYGRLSASRGPAASGASPAADGSRWPRRLRARAAERLESRLPGDVAPMARALVLAERADLDPRITRRFADAGLVHLLAISGLHVGFLAGGLLWMAGAAVRGRWRYGVAVAAVGAYVGVIGAPPAALRALLLFAGWAAARARGAPARAGDLLGAAAIVILAADPILLVHAGFQLSFAGFGGLMAGEAAVSRALEGGRRGGRWRRSGRVRSAARALGASAGAFLSTAPIAAAHFGRVAPAAVVSNLVGVPLVGGALAALVGTLLLPGPAGALAAGAAAAILRLLRRVAEAFADLPLHGDAAPPAAADWIAMLLLLAAGAGVLAGRRWVGSAVPLGAALAVWVAGPAVRALSATRATLVCALDVGQGDAAALRTRGGRWIVFDAGPGPGFGRGAGGPARGRALPDAGRRVLVPFLRSRGARAVDLLVLSHPHLDHLGGAAALFDAFPVRRVLEPGHPAPSPAYIAFLEGVEEEGAEWLRGTSGSRLRIDEVELLVLAPDAPPGDAAAGGGRVGHGPGGGERLAVRDANDVSVGVRVRVGDRFTYMNTGDAPAEVEGEILRRWPRDSLRADVLKLGHHGSRDATSAAWLGAVRPRVAVISAGRGNRYGHPHRSTLARLDSAGVARVWRTDREGTLCVRVDRRGGWTLPEG